MPSRRAEAVPCACAPLAGHGSIIHYSIPNKMRHILTTLIATAVAAIAAQAQAVTAVTTAPGTLQSAIGTDAGAVSVLVVQGPIDAGDMEFVNTRMPALETLDLKDATVEAYYGAGHSINGVQRYDAGLLPPMIFAGLRASSVTLPSMAGLRIGTGAFAGASLATVTIPGNVAEVGDGAFAGCASLASATVEASAGLGTDIFAGCTALSEVRLPALAAIPVRMFDGCTSLATVAAAPTLETIGEAAFRGCKSLKNFSFPASLSSVGTSAFESSGLETVDMSGCTSLFKVGEYAFANCASLAEAVFADNTSEMGEGALFNCARLATLSLPGNLGGLGTALLSNAAIAGKFELPKRAMTVGDYALADAASITEVSVPSSLFYLGTEAMSGMSGLSRIDAKDLGSVPATGDDVWRGVDQPEVELVVADGQYDAFKTAGQWKEFNIVKGSGTDDIADIAEVSCRGRFVGTDLHISATGAELSRVMLYDVSGRLLADVEAGGSEAVIPTSDYSARAYVAEVRLADGVRATVKLVR